MEDNAKIRDLKIICNWCLRIAEKTKEKINGIFSLKEGLTEKERIILKKYDL